MALKEEFEYEGVRLFRHRGWLPVVLLAAGLAVYLLTARSAAVSAVCWRCYEYVCLAVSLCGLSVRIFTVGHTPTGTSGRNTARQVAESLNTTGIYSLVRHPLYLGNFPHVSRHSHADPQRVVYGCVRSCFLDLLRAYHVCRRAVFAL